MDQRFCHGQQLARDRTYNEVETCRNEIFIISESGANYAALNAEGKVIAILLRLNIV